MSNTERPQVTLTYAQSLDGSIAAAPGAPLALSGPEARRFTHTLRASHDAILVGIGTVLTDDPQLTVREIEGRDPRPVILDSRLRCPPTARCVDRARRTLVLAGPDAPAERQAALEAAGARILRVPPRAEDPARLDLDALLACLYAEGIRTLMVEGGSRVITSFLQSGRVDRVILTMAPVLVGGVRAVRDLLPAPFPRLRDVTVERLGDDWIVSGTL